MVIDANTARGETQQREASAASGWPTSVGDDRAWRISEIRVVAVRAIEHNVAPVDQGQPGTPTIQILRTRRISVR
jgi:hypothetical protein